MTSRRTCVSAVLVLVMLAGVRAADPSGKWTSTFPTEVGEQVYTFEFVVKGTTVTGTIEGNLTGKSQVVDGKVDGDKITFTEKATVMEMPLTITYAGTMTSADEIAFVRDVSGLAMEKLTAKRAK